MKEYIVEYPDTLQHVLDDKLRDDIIQYFDYKHTYESFLRECVTAKPDDLPILRMSIKEIQRTNLPLTFRQSPGLLSLEGTLDDTVVFRWTIPIPRYIYVPHVLNDASLEHLKYELYRTMVEKQHQMTVFTQNMYQLETQHDHKEISQEVYESLMESMETQIQEDERTLMNVREEYRRKLQEYDSLSAVRYKQQDAFNKVYHTAVLRYTESIRYFQGLMNDLRSLSRTLRGDERKRLLWKAYLFRYIQYQFSRQDVPENRIGSLYVLRSALPGGTSSAQQGGAKKKVVLRPATASASSSSAVRSDLEEELQEIAETYWFVESWDSHHNQVVCHNLQKEQRVFRTEELTYVYGLFYIIRYMDLLYTFHKEHPMQDEDAIPSVSVFENIRNQKRYHQENPVYIAPLPAFMKDRVRERLSKTATAKARLAKRKKTAKAKADAKAEAEEESAEEAVLEEATVERQRPEQLGIQHPDVERSYMDTSDLYSNERITRFIIQHTARNVPAGKGFGERLDPRDARDKKYEGLSVYYDWRRMLSDEWISEDNYGNPFPIFIDGKPFASVIHYLEYQRLMSVSLEEDSPLFQQYERMANHFLFSQYSAIHSLSELLEESAGFASSPEWNEIPEASKHGLTRRDEAHLHAVYMKMMQFPQLVTLLEETKEAYLIQPQPAIAVSGSRAKSFRECAVLMRVRSLMISRRASRDSLPIYKSEESDIRLSMEYASQLALYQLENQKHMYESSESESGYMSVASAVSNEWATTLLSDTEAQAEAEGEAKGTPAVEERLPLVGSYTFMNYYVLVVELDEDDVYYVACHIPDATHEAPEALGYYDMRTHRIQFFHFRRRDDLDYKVVTRASDLLDEDDFQVKSLVSIPYYHNEVGELFVKTIHDKVYEYQRIGKLSEDSRGHQVILYD